MLAELPVMVAGVPASMVRERDLTAVDELGLVPLTGMVTDSPVVAWPSRRWLVGRPTVGEVEVCYVAPYRTVDRDTRAGHPPLDLRREAGGVTGTGVTFLAVPPPSGRWRLTLRWQPSGSAISGVSSLGVGDVATEGTTEVLRDSHYMAGDLAGNSERCRGVTAWWLTPPAFDVSAFTARISRLHEIMADSFDGSAGEFQVFLRSNPYPGLGASAFPSSFVVGYDGSSPPPPERTAHLLAHELVHGWLHLDGDPDGDPGGEPDQMVWFDEGAADYFATVLPYRHGLLSPDAFLRRVNLDARLCFANPYRDRSLAEASALAWTDFRAQQLPYGRGMFYLADLDTRLAACSPAGSLLKLVQQVASRYRSGRPMRLADWIDMVSAVTGVDEAPVIDAMAVQAGRRPQQDLWGSAFEYFTDDAPVIDPGFDPSTFVTRRITGVTPDGPAASAGLADGDRVLSMPSYEELVLHRPGQPFTITVQRDGQTHTAVVDAAREHVQVPAWRPRRT
jgi:hypothetical protein